MIFAGEAGRAFFLFLRVRAGEVSFFLRVRGGEGAVFVAGEDAWGGVDKYDHQKQNADFLWCWAGNPVFSEIVICKHFPDAP